MKLRLFLLSLLFLYTQAFAFDVSELLDTRDITNEETTAQIEETTTIESQEYETKQDTIKEDITRIEYFNTFKWVKYYLWAKNPNKWKIDCSGLISYFLYNKWKISMDDVVKRMSSKNLFDRYNDTDVVRPAKEWDMVFFHSLDKDTNHIGIVKWIEVEDWWHKLTLRDSSYPNNWLSERTLDIRYINNDNIYCNLWYCYNIFYKRFLDKEEIWQESEVDNKKEEINITKKQEHKEEETNQYYFTHYNVWDVGQNDSSPCHWALTKADLCELVSDNFTRPIAITKDIRLKLWLKARDKVELEWDEWCRWTYKVLDDMNKRFRERCIKKNWACIKWDIALPMWVHKNNWVWAGGKCSIKPSKKKSLS